MNIEQDRYWLVARDKAALLTHMMRLLAGDAQISFEGNLSRCSFPDSVPRLPEESSVLRRQTIWPVQDFAVLKLEHETIYPILDTVLPDNRFMEDIIHIQIAQHGKLQFGSYDQFDQRCIVCFLGVPTKILDDLRQRRVILSWTTPYAGAVRGGHG
jgi:hypothetical protein